MNKNSSITETEASATVFVEDATVKPVEEENFEYTNLNSTLMEIKKTEGVTGYILKSQTSATIDLDEPSCLADYALLTSAVMDSSQQVTKLFNIGKVENVTVEAKNVKALCIIKGENRASVFMQKNVDDTEVLKKIENKLATPKTPP
jgi:predicted regulator of Ras-like GTPase activity (Roadblock/LC7/MglB family)